MISRLQNESNIDIIQNGAAGNPPTNEYSLYLVQPLASVSPVQLFTQYSNVEMSIVADMFPQLTYCEMASFFSNPQSRWCDK